MSNVAIIPARGGSKRIPRKNIKPFLEKEIIAYSIEAALGCEVIDRVIVSTDDDEIAQVAVKYGADVPFKRPQFLADDHTGTGAVICHALDWLKNEGNFPEYACLLYATAPFVTSEILISAYRDLLTSGRYFAFSVASFVFPVQRALKMTESGGVTPFYPQFMTSRSQDLEPAYHDAGQFYWGKSEGWLNGHDVFSDESLPIVLPRHLVQDIDDEEDWLMAELKYRAHAQLQKAL